MHYGLHITQSSSSDLVIYSSVDWAGCPDTRTLHPASVLMSVQIWFLGHLRGSTLSPNLVLKLSIEGSPMRSPRADS
jgi:hypothetical protein